MRFIRAWVFVGHGVAPAGTGSTPNRPRLGLAVGVAEARAAVPAELDEVVTGRVVVDARLPAEHPASKAAATRKTMCRTRIRTEPRTGEKLQPTGYSRQSSARQVTGLGTRKRPCSATVGDLLALARGGTARDSETDQRHP
jgi:hypothetical protein